MAMVVDTASNGAAIVQRPNGKIVNSKTGKDVTSQYVTTKKPAAAQGSVSQAVVAGRADPIPNTSGYTVYSGTNRATISPTTGKVTATASGAYNKPSSGGGSSGGGSSPRQIIETLSTDGYYNQLLDYFKDKNEEARSSAIKAIMQRLETLKGMYGTQMEDLDEEYQKLINQNEVQRYKSKGAIREALANRGQLDSGLGRQEQLYLDTKYGNQTSNLKAQKQKAKQDIQNLINQAIAEAEADKAETNNAYNNALLQYELANA